MTEPAVQFGNVSKRFHRGGMHDSLRDWVSAGLARLRGGRRAADTASTFWALKEVSFTVAPGEALGIIGPNGAGKSTALKLLAGILRPDGGHVRVSGRLGALIEISAGMHGDLTGRENIYLGGAIMGMSRREIDAKLEAIVEFSGLADFLDTPVKRYSTGMTARLGFSVAAHIDPDVLLVDEVLSVGDIAFRQRCEAHMRELVRRGTALVFVTHNLEQMRAVCHRAVVLDRGRATFSGDPAAAVEEYMRATMQAVDDHSYMDRPREAATTGRVLGVRYLDKAGREVGTIRNDQPLDIEIAFRLDRLVSRLSVETTIRSLGAGVWVNFNSAREGRTYRAAAGIASVCVHLPSLPLGAGSYLAKVRMWDADRCELVAETPAMYPLLIDDRGRTTGMLALPNEWSLDAEPAGDDTPSEGAPCEVAMPGGKP